MIKFRTAYGPKANPTVDFSKDKGRTIQEQKQGTDINYIMERFTRTGLIEHVRQNEPQFGDFTGIDFQEMQDQVAKVKQLFDSLPSKVKQQFEHDPQKYLDFIAHQENVQDMKDGEIGNSQPKKEQGSDEGGSTAEGGTKGDPGEPKKD